VLSRLPSQFIVSKESSLMTKSLPAPNSSKILITGGSGFIGTNLVEYFSELGSEVLNLSLEPPASKRQLNTYRSCDILDSGRLLRYLREFSPDYVVHLAARTDLDGKTIDDYASNVLGVNNVIKSVNKVSTVRRVIYASSRLVFAINHFPRHLYDYKPSTLYGQSKVAGECLVRSQPTGSVPWSIVRPTSIWGEWFGVPYRNFFDSVLRHRYVHPDKLTVLKSFGYVGNTCHQLSRLLMASDHQFNSQVYFLADYAPIDLYMFAAEISRQAGAGKVSTVPPLLLFIAACSGSLLKSLGLPNPPLTRFRYNNLVSNMIYDLSREAEVFGPLPYDLNTSIAKTLSWMKKNI
jgi:GlcNAc-P-P-Und epimerase